MENRNWRLNLESMKTTKPKFKLPSVGNMTLGQIEVWQRIAVYHRRKVVLINGIVIDAAGRLFIDEDIARVYENNTL